MTTDILSRKKSTGSHVADKTGSISSNEQLEMPELYYYNPRDDYPIWLTKERVMGFIYSLPKDPWWNALFCIYVLALVTSSCCIQLNPPLPPSPANLKTFITIITIEIPYIFHVTTLICNNYHNYQLGESSSLFQVGYIIDVISLTVPFVTALTMGICKESELIDLVAITLRMHRPFTYLGSLNYYLKGSIIGTLLKYIYISIAIRVFLSFCFVCTGQIQDQDYEEPYEWLKKTPQRQMFRAFYQINKIFIPVGPDLFPKNDFSRIWFIVAMLSGVLFVLGIAIASLSLIIGLYMRPEEEFRARFRLIMDDMVLNQTTLCMSIPATRFSFWVIDLFHPAENRSKRRQCQDTKEAYILAQQMMSVPSHLLTSNYFGHGVEIKERAKCLTDPMNQRRAAVPNSAPPPGVQEVTSYDVRTKWEYLHYYRHATGNQKKTNLPVKLRKKVETFYRMFWHKQKAVSETRLLPIYPHCLVTAIRTNIYYQAMQKSRVICNLPNSLLSEIAKRMETVHYIPGDFIIKRNNSKSVMIFISYGDVELLSAEDDETALLRFTRGTILNPFGVCAELACTRSYVAIGAATFCTAHVLKTNDLWLVAAKYGHNGEPFILHAAAKEHFQKIKRHFVRRIRPPFKYKSNIILLKRALMDLKEARDDNGNLLLERTDMFINIAGCYMMRNQTDMSLTEEADEICLRPSFPCILQPESSLLFTWKFFVAIISIVVVFVHPYYLVYIKDVPVGFRFFNYMVSLVYVLDTMVFLSTGTKVEEGVPLTFMNTASEQMKSCWFIINVISVLPIFELIGTGHYAGINKLARIPQIFRMMKYLEDISVYHSNGLRLFSFFLLVIILTYLFGALQQYFGCVTFGYCLLKNFTHSPYWVKEPLDNGPVDARLTFSLYYAISIITFTTHKTAQFAKTLWRYQFFILILLEVCVIVHILIEGTYSATIMVTKTMRDRYKTCIETVKTFLVKNNMDPVLRHRFINYLQLCWYTDKAYGITHEKNSILFDLPTHVNEDILTMQRSKYFLSTPFMKFLPNDVLKKISAQARLFYTAPNEVLLNTGDISNEIYVIKEGVCEVLDPQTKKVVRLLSAKGYFGDIECLLRLPAYYSVRAATYVHLYSISKKHLEKCVSIPKIKDAITYAKELPEYRALLNAQEAFVTYKMVPLSPNREYFPLPRKHESDFAFLQPFTMFGHLSILRYVFPRYTFRPDGQYLKRYEWFRAACALASINVFPFYNFLVLQWPWLWHVAWLLDFSAYYDIFQRMLVGYFDDNGILIYHPASTFVHYLKGAFLVDLLGCLPLEFLDYVRTTIYFKDNAYKHPATFSILMYNRLLQLYRVPDTLDILDDYVDRQDIILMIKVIPVLLTLINTVTSLMLEASVEKWKPVNGSWRLEIIQDPVHGSWIEQNGASMRYNITATPWNAVLTTFYWVVYETTSTGFNLFQPGQLCMMSVLTTGMLLGSVITTYYAVRVISIRSNVNQALGSFQEHMKDIIKFMKKEKLDKELQRNVVSHYKNRWDRMGGTDYCSILKLCDQITLRTDAILHIYGKTFTMCPILLNDVSLLRNVGRAVKSTYMRKMMTVVERDDVISEMYVVDRGFVEMHGAHDGQQITYLPRGSVFGNLDNLNTIVCPTKFVTGSNVHLLAITADKFYIIIQDFPAVKILLEQYRPNNETYIASNCELDETFRTRKSQNEFGNTTHMNNRKKALKFFLKHRKAVQLYSIIISMLCVYGDLYNAGFQDNGTALIIALYVLDLCFFIKILLQVFLPYMAKKGTDTRNELLCTSNEYHKRNFKYDILSCIPIEVLCFIRSSPQTAFAFLRLNRCLRLRAVQDSVAQYHKNLTINLTITTVASVFIWFMLFVHAATCIWYYLGVMEDNRKPFSSWRYKNMGENETMCGNQYICAVYFILTTFSLNGVGDILPRQQSEVFFVCVLMILSTIIFMIYVGEFSNIIQYRSFRYYAFYSKYLELLAFLKNNRVSENLITVTKYYTLHLWQEARGCQVPYFLETAPQCLRLNIMSAAYMYHLTSHPVFKQCESSFLRQLVGHLQLLHFSEELRVVKQGEICNSMYFVHKGRVKEIDEESDDIYRVYKAGECFGSLNGLVRDVPFEVSYKTIIKSKILTLCFDDWEYLLHHFPNNKNIMNFYKDSSSSQSISLNEISKRKKKYLKLKPKPTVHHLPFKSIQQQKFELSSISTSRSFDMLDEGVDRFQKTEEIPVSPWPMESRRSTAAGSTFPEELNEPLSTAEEDTMNPYQQEKEMEIQNPVTKFVNKTDTKEQLNEISHSNSGIGDTLQTNNDISKDTDLKQSLLQNTLSTEKPFENDWPIDTRRSTAAGSTISRMLPVDKNVLPNYTTTNESILDLPSIVSSSNKLNDSLSPKKDITALVEQTSSELFVNDDQKETIKQSVNQQLTFNTLKEGFTDQEIKTREDMIPTIEKNNTKLSDEQISESGILSPKQREKQNMRPSKGDFVNLSQVKQLTPEKAGAISTEQEIKQWSLDITQSTRPNVPVGETASKITFKGLTESLTPPQELDLSQGPKPHATYSSIKINEPSTSKLKYAELEPLGLLSNKVSKRIPDNQQLLQDARESIHTVSPEVLLELSESDPELNKNIPERKISLKVPVETIKTTKDIINSSNSPDFSTVIPSSSSGATNENKKKTLIEVQTSDVHGSTITLRQLKEQFISLEEYLMENNIGQTEEIKNKVQSGTQLIEKRKGITFQNTIEEPSITIEHRQQGNDNDDATTATVLQQKNDTESADSNTTQPSTNTEN